MNIINAFETLLILQISAGSRYSATRKIMSPIIWDMKSVWLQVSGARLWVFCIVVSFVTLFHKSPNSRCRASALSVSVNCGMTKPVRKSPCYKGINAELVGVKKI
mmetsp:Transcript_1079/g.2135  ORF Transcript_1079/g.2135 Transcript_1079/m.2135 type:complete len:105 (-) Transcript_1079:131-445(-)